LALISIGPNLAIQYHHPPNVQNGGGIKQINPFEPPFPIRPTEPTCQYYLKHGTCKFGQTCKFHHPHLPRQNSEAFPQRPGEPDCIYYLRNGRCKYGVTCKYHHPISAHRPRSSSLSSITEVGSLPIHLVRNSDGSSHLIVSDGPIVMVNRQHVYPPYCSTAPVSPMMSPHASSYETASTLDLMGGSSHGHGNRVPTVSSCRQLPLNSTGNTNMNYSMTDSRSNSDNSLNASIHSAPLPGSHSPLSLNALSGNGMFCANVNNSFRQRRQYGHSCILGKPPIVDSHLGQNNIGNESFYMDGNSELNHKTNVSFTGSHSAPTTKFPDATLSRSEIQWASYNKPSSPFTSPKRLSRVLSNSNVSNDDKRSADSDDDGMVTMTSALLNMLDIDESVRRKTPPSNLPPRAKSLGSSKLSYSDIKDLPCALTEESKSSHFPSPCHQVHSEAIVEGVLPHCKYYIPLNNPSYRQTGHRIPNHSLEWTHPTQSLSKQNKSYDLF